MSEPSDQLALELPELAARTNDSPMVAAARTTLEQLHRDGLISVRNAVMVQLVLSLAEAIDGGRRNGRASAVAMAAKELREAILILDPPPEGGPVGGEDKLAAFIAAVETAAQGQGIER